MSKTFTYIEPSSRRISITDPYHCDSANEIVLIYRILSGSLDLENKLLEKQVACRFDFVKKSKHNKKINNRYIIDGMFGEGTTESAARESVKKLNMKHRVFFKRLSSELQHCIFSYNTKNYTESFLCFYRCLEKLAVAFPIVYISDADDFHKVHEFLKPLFSGGSSGELSFLKKFCNEIAQKSELLKQYTIDIEFELNSRSIIQEVSRCILNKSKITAEIDDNRIAISYEQFSSFIITCRNRLFHNSNDGQPNIDIDTMGGTGSICQGLTRAGLEWLTLTYLEVIRSRANQIL